MTIDEAIAHAREVSSRKFDDRVHCIRCSEFYEQLAEWLEELKSYRAHIFSGDMTRKMLKEAYNKAIDDFAEKLHHEEFCNEYGVHIVLTPQQVDELAEQLKEKKK